VSAIITLKNVRLSFPTIWTPKAFNEGQAPKFSANFLLDKETQADQIKALREKIKQAALEAFNGNVPPGIKICIGDGVEKAYDGYDGSVYLACSTRQRPVIVDRDKTPLAEEDGRPQAGDYVNAAISLWVQNNQWGKRVNANLNAIQFVREGERFGSGAVSADSVFDDISSEQDQDALAEAESDFLS
jgi:hypothetical protein